MQKRISSFFIIRIIIINLDFKIIKFYNNYCAIMIIFFSIKVYIKKKNEKSNKK